MLLSLTISQGKCGCTLCKSEVFELFEEFKAAMEKLTGIKALRCDNGGEYSSNATRDYLKNCSTQAQKTIVYTPQ